MRRRLPARRKVPVRTYAALQLLPDLLRGDLLVAKRQDRRTRKSIQTTDFRELGDDVFGDSVAEVFVFFCGA